MLQHTLKNVLHVSNVVVEVSVTYVITVGQLRPMARAHKSMAPGLLNVTQCRLIFVGASMNLASCNTVGASNL